MVSGRLCRGNANDLGKCTVGDAARLLSLSSVIIQHAVWLCLRSTLSYRDAEELLAELGLDLTYKTVQR
jgi:hypothetical protein